MSVYTPTFASTSTSVSLECGAHLEVTKYASSTFCLQVRKNDQNDIHIHAWGCKTQRVIA